MKKYNVGDKVRVVSNLAEGDEIEGCLVCNDMIKWSKEFVTISEIGYIENRYKISEDTTWFWSSGMFEEIPTISLKLEWIEEGEKFNLVDSNGHIEYREVHIEGNMLYVYDTSLEMTLGELLVGILTIEKIPQKTETEIEIEKLRAQVAEVNAQIDKLEGTL